MDAKLIDQLHSDSEEAFEQVYHDFHQKLYFYFLKKTRSAAASEDLVQETFIKLWRYRAGLDAGLPISAQLFRMARTTLIDVLRKRAEVRTESLAALDEPAVALPLAVPSEGTPELSRVRDALFLLTPARRQIIEQKLAGFSNQEIADRLSISRKTVENQINRAFHEIRKHVAVPLFLLLIVLRKG